MRMIAPWTRQPGTERTDTKSPEHMRVRLRVLARDGNACYKCGAYSTQVDHITPVFEGGPTNETNMAAICEQCHRHKSALEGVRAKRERAS